MTRKALSIALAGLSLAGTLVFASSALAQGGPPRPPPPANARVGAPVDLTGQWVSVITEDWRWRMRTPGKGDYSSVPLNPAGIAATGAWNLAADNAAGNQCKAFGAGGIMRMPMRIRISWQGDDTLKVETDAGQQTKLLKFISSMTGGVLPALNQFGPAPAERTWQGESRAQWFKEPQARALGFGGPPGKGGALRVVTRNMKAGYLRRNGVPYSENAVITEQYNRHDEPNGDSWITVTTIVEDPQYLRQPFVTTSSFKRETDAAKWAPAPCSTPVPLEKGIEGAIRPVIEGGPQ
jgi:hypothetical protein